MTNSLKRLVLVSLTNLVSNSLGTMLALQNNLVGDFGGWLNGQDVLRDFLGFKGTALSAPLPFMLIQLGLTILALQPGRSGRIGVGGLTFMGAIYTIGQLGEPIVLRVSSPGGFDPAHAVVLFVNVASSIVMLVLGIQVWSIMRATRPVASRSMSSTEMRKQFCYNLRFISLLIGTNSNSQQVRKFSRPISLRYREPAHISTGSEGCSCGYRYSKETNYGKYPR